MSIKVESVFNERGKELTGKCIQLEWKWVGNEEESKFNERVHVGNKKGKCIQRENKRIDRKV